jgi:hypothetical protein
MSHKKQPEGFSVEGIVAARDGMPYIKLFNNGAEVCQLTMAQARNVAHDILTMCARTEADAMLFKFFFARDLPAAACSELMFDFRMFRHALDSEEVEKTVHTPSSDPKPQ